MLIGCLLVFAGLYVYFIIKVWTADGDQVPDLDNQLIYAASALGGILGTFFAVSLGIQRNDPSTDQSKLHLGPTLVGVDAGLAPILATVALWTYAAVGVAAGATAIFQAAQTPDPIKAIAATFGGYALAVFGAAFASPAGGGE
jgi:hypothetical protein